MRGEPRFEREMRIQQQIAETMVMMLCGKLLRGGLTRSRRHREETRSRGALHYRDRDEQEKLRWVGSNEPAREDKLELNSNKVLFLNGISFLRRHGECPATTY
jgi:hypothetical protein